MPRKTKEPAPVEHHAFWRHEETGDVYGVKLRGTSIQRTGEEDVIGVCGPLEASDQTGKALHVLAFGTALVAFVTANAFVEIDPDSERAAKADQVTAEARTPVPLSAEAFEASVCTIGQEVTDLRERFEEANRVAKKRKKAWEDKQAALMQVITERTNPKPLLDLAEQADATAEEVVSIPVGLLMSDEERELSVDLVNDIEEFGVQTPLTVHAEDGCYRVVEGLEQFFAGQKVGLTSFPCLVQDATT